MRVYELAKKLGKTSKEVLSFVQTISTDVKGHFSKLDEKTLKKVNSHYQNKQKDRQKNENPIPKFASVSKSQTQSLSEQKKTSSKTVPLSSVESAKKNSFTKVQTDSSTSSSSHLETKNKNADNDEIREIFIKFPVTVKKLSKELKIKANELVQKLMKRKIFATINQELSKDLVEDLILDYNYILTSENTKKKPSSQQFSTKDLFTDNPSEKTVTRAPIVTMMGHVDHGKTSLLNALYKKTLNKKEAGGITQHIGAYKLEMGSRSITFIDTPGHETFSAMRARGAQITDIVVLVVASDEGVKPQTIEAINHARSANVTIIVALNKSDKPDADPEKVRTELSKHNLLSEQWGGDTIFVNVSAKTSEGLDTLIEMILLQSEMLELKGNPDALAKGVVIETHVSRGRGSMVSVIVTNGTLSTGQILLSQNTFGKVKALMDDRGLPLRSATVSTPVQVLGFDTLPKLGDRFTVLKNEKELRYHQQNFLKSKKIPPPLDLPSKPFSLEDLYEQMDENKVKEINLIIKSDTYGSLEALKEALLKLNNSKVKLKIIHSGLGSVQESDLTLAQSTQAFLIAFHVKVDAKIQKLSEKKGLNIKNYDVIYQVIDDIYSSMETLLDEKEIENVIGKVEIRALFKSSKLGSILGCFVVSGKVLLRSNVRIFRKSEQIGEDTIQSIKREKDESKEVRAGFECGITLNKFKDIEVGDILEVYSIEKQKQFLND